MIEESRDAELVQRSADDIPPATPEHLAELLAGMDEPERPECGTCPYFQISAIESEANNGQGNCRRFPPILMPDAYGKGYNGYSQDDYALVDTMAHFVSVNAVGWCGEHPQFDAYIAAMKAHSSSG